MVTDVLCDLHKWLYLPVYEPVLIIAAFLGCQHHNTVGFLSTASQPNPEVRHPASQLARLSILGQCKVVVSYNVACALKNNQQEGNTAIHSAIQLVNTHFPRSPDIILCSVSNPFFSPKG